MHCSCSTQYYHVGDNTRHIKGMIHSLIHMLKQWWMPLAENVPLLYSIDQLPWWLRPALCIMKLMFSKSSVAQSACCLLKALKARLLIVTQLDCALCSLFTSLYYALSFSSFSPLTLSHCSPGKWGGNDESFLGISKSVCVCVYVCKCAHGWLCDSGVWAVKPEKWAGKERSSSTMQTVKGRDPLLCPFSPTIALGEIQQLHHSLTDTQGIRL